MTSEHVIWLLIGLGVGYLLWKDGKHHRRIPLWPGNGQPATIAGENLPSDYGTAGTTSQCNVCGGGL